MTLCHLTPHYGGPHGDWTARYYLWRVWVPGWIGCWLT